MEELLQYFLEVNRIFWGDDIYQIWFYVSILLILFLEKKKTNKIVFAWYSIIFLVGLFNPISNRIMSFVASAWQYRARLYSMLPIPYVLATGTILLIDTLYCPNQKGLRETETESESGIWSRLFKVSMVVGICILIVLGGTDVYQQDWMQPAQNLHKVPSPVLELSTKLGNQKDIKIAVPDSLSSYIRQVDASFYMPYGRNVNELGLSLSQENPDPMYVMTEAGKEGCTYIIVYSNEVNVENFRNSGYEVYDQISGYLIYKVENVYMLHQMHNEKHQVIRTYYTDENGKLIENSEGYTGIVFDYDSEGNRCKEIYIDKDGKRITTKRGYSAIAKTYTHVSRQLSSIKYLDEEDNPILINGRFETRKTYNHEHLLETESYYDQNGVIMNRTDYLYASRKLRYDDNNNVTGESFYGTNGELTLVSDGYASYSQERDDKGNIIRVSFFGTDGEPIRIVYGYAELSREYNENGKQSRETYYDEKGKPIARNKGYTQIRWDYYESDKKIYETYWDEEEKPYTLAEGYHGIIREYDESGNEISEVFLDEKGQIINVMTNIKP